MSIRPDQIDGSFIPIRADFIASVEVDREGVLLNNVSGSLHLLNPIANIVWLCMDGSGTIEQLAEDLSREFRVSREMVQRDIVALIQEFGRRGLLDGVAAEVLKD